MPRQFRIRVRATPRANPDPAMLAQIVILFGRYLHEQRHQQKSTHEPSTHHTTRDTEKALDSDNHGSKP